MMRSKARLWWGVLAIVALAINLRPGATSLGPVLAEVQAGDLVAEPVLTETKETSR